MPQTSELPAGFEKLAPYAETWGALHDQEQRYLLRQSSSMEELKSYYDDAVALMDEAFDHLDPYGRGPLPEPEALLFRIMLGLSEAAMAIEVFGQPRVPFAPYPHKMAIEWVEYE